jgi:hypothetical protein
MSTLAATIKAAITGNLTSTVTPGTASYAINNALETISFTEGTTTGLADRIYTATRTLAASANETLDLAGALTTPLGAACVFAKVKAIMITADANNTNNVVVGNATNPFPGPLSAGATTVTLGPGDVFLWTRKGAGIAVGAGATDEVKVANSGAGTGVTYTITVIGTSA